MSDPKRTAGYAQRLAEALAEDAPRPMSVRQLAEEVRAAYPGLRGTSYGGIRQYVQGNIKSPRVELLRAIADVLGVRPDWLAFGKGPMTEEEEETQRAVEGTTRVWDWREDIRVVQEEFGDGSDRLADDPLVRMVILGTWTQLTIGGLFPRLPPDTWDGDPPRLSGIAKFLAGYMNVPRDPPDRKIFYAVGRALGRALRAPFSHLPIRAEDLSDSEFLDYVTLICQGLRGLADAHRRKAKDPSKHTEKEEERLDG